MTQIVFTTEQAFVGPEQIEYALLRAKCGDIEFCVPYFDGYIEDYKKLLTEVIERIILIREGD